MIAKLQYCSAGGTLAHSPGWAGEPDSCGASEHAMLQLGHSTGSDLQRRRYEERRATHLYDVQFINVLQLIQSCHLLATLQAQPYV